MSGRPPRRSKQNRSKAKRTKRRQEGQQRQSCNAPVGRTTLPAQGRTNGRGDGGKEPPKKRKIRPGIVVLYIAAAGLVVAIVAAYYTRMGGLAAREQVDLARAPLVGPKVKISGVWPVWFDPRRVLRFDFRVVNLGEDTAYETTCDRAEILLDKSGKEIERRNPALDDPANQAAAITLAPNEFRTLGSVVDDPTYLSNLASGVWIWDVEHKCTWKNRHGGLGWYEGRHRYDPKQGAMVEMESKSS